MDNKACSQAGKLQTQHKALPRYVPVLKDFSHQEQREFARQCKDDLLLSVHPLKESCLGLFSFSDLVFF